MAVNIDLNGIWKLTGRAIDGAPDVPECNAAIDARVPGDVHEDLMRAGLLPEPLVGANAPKHEWVERAVFTYEREFSVDPDFDRAELVFDGLDCLAEVFIDGQLVGSSANAHVPHCFDVTSFVKSGETHTLKVNIDTGVEWAKKQDPGECRCDDNIERIFLRKSQFSFKWDWAPRLVTCGIWRDAQIKLHKSVILRDVFLNPTFENVAARLEAKVQVEALTEGNYLLNLRVNRNGEVWENTQRVHLAPGTNEASASVYIDPVERWYPADYGDQALYDVQVEIGADGEIFDSHTTTYGFREIKVRQDELSDGEKSFVVNVNGIDVFCKGANWVPADSICARVSDEKYETLITEARAANFNMFRIWGGGIYEDDVFYDLCDRHGIMIWHDFMFACAEYPEDKPEFVENVRDEITKVVRRLRHHPCIALWCGNNENDWIFGFYGRGKDGKCSYFYGENLGHDVCPSICSTLDPQRFYWPSSPFGGDDPNCEQCGDRHAWQVSIHDRDLTMRADVRNYRKDRGKFNSEYGVISYALPRTILDYTQDGAIDLKSEAYKVHDNSFNAGVTETESLTDWYLKVGFGSIPQDPLTYIEQSLAYQAMGYRESISSFRIRKFDCTGSLFWMYSDCWGTLGWTIIDYYLRRKPSFYWVKKAYAPVAVFARYENSEVKTYIVNDTLEELNLDVMLDVGELSGTPERTTMKMTVPANGVAIGPALPFDSRGYALVQALKDGNVISDDLTLTHFPAEMDIPQAKVSADIVQHGDELEITVRSDAFGHFVYLDLPDGAKPTDNYFNLLPSRPKVVRVSGVKPDQVKASAFNAAQCGQ